MPNPLDQIADAIAGAILPAVETVEETLTPLPPATPDTAAHAILIGRGHGDLDRFILPPFKSPLDGSLIEGLSSNVLRHLGRTPQDSIRVTFPDPVYGIWLDPNFSSPGAQISVAYSGTNRGNFIPLTPGEGFRLQNPIQEIRVMNGDGLDQLLGIYPGGPSTFPLGYASFLVALNPNPEWRGTIPRGKLNVSALIQQGYYLASQAGTAPADSALVFPAGINWGLIATNALKRIRLEILPKSVGGNAITGGFHATFLPWYIGQFSNDPILPNPPTSLDVLSPNVKGRWIRGRPFSIASRQKSAADTRTAGCERVLDIPPGRLAMAFELLAYGNTTGNANETVGYNVFGE